MPTAGAGRALEQLAATDPAVAPLARLQAVALDAAADPSWERSLPASLGPRAEAGAPRLHGARLVVDSDRLRALFVQLVAALDAAGHPDSARLRQLFAAPGFDPPAGLRASLVHDVPALEDMAARVAATPGVLVVVAQAAALPLLVACGRRATATLDGRWTLGYCPVCAAWPTLAEVRGLARELVLRCGRCGTGWPCEHRRCPFCGHREQHSQRYFAAAHERETRRAITCSRCHGYLKVLATLEPLAPSEILLRDLESLELDVTALEHGYRRPEGLGWSLALTVESAPPPRGWLRWRG